MKNSTEILKSEISGLIDLINNHVLLGDSERNKLNLIIRNYDKQTSLDANDDDFKQLISQLNIMKQDLKLREVGEVNKQNTISAYGTDLIDDEIRLKASIANEKRGQYVVLFIVSGLLLAFSFYLIYIINYMISQKDVSLKVMVIQLAVTFIFATIFYFLFRIFQNSREAAERMDEKTIGITFLIYGLKFMTSNPNNDSILRIAAEMFLGHQGTSSKTLSDKEYKDFTNSLVHILPNLKVKD